RLEAEERNQAPQVSERGRGYITLPDRELVERRDERVVELWVGFLGSGAEGELRDQRGSGEGGQVAPEVLPAADEGEVRQRQQVPALPEVEERFPLGEGFQERTEAATRPLRALRDHRSHPVV